MDRSEELATLIVSELEGDYPGSAIELVEGILRRGELTWTSTRPSTPGWYWWRTDKHDEFHDMKFVRQNAVNGKLYASLLLDGDARSYSRSVEEFGYGEWAGPLVPPEEG